MEKLREKSSGNRSHPRSYLRWHWSTIFLTLMPAAVLAFIAYPFSTYVITFGEGYQASGWPAAHFIRAVDESTLDDLEDDSAFWLTESLPFYKKYFKPEKVETWNYAGGRSCRRWLPLGLAFNLMTGLLVCGSLGLLLERRRRSRSSFFRVSIADLLVLLVVISSGFALFGNVHRAARMHHQADFLLRRKFNNAPYQRQGANGYAPTWFNHLTVGNPRFGLTEVVLPDGTRKPKPLYWRIGIVRKHGTVSRLHVYDHQGHYCIELVLDSGKVEHLFCKHNARKNDALGYASFLRSFSKVETLHVNSKQFNPANDLGGGKFQQLTHLVIHDGQMDNVEAEWALAQPALKIVDVRAGFIGDCNFGNLQTLFPGKQVEDISEYHRRVILR